MNIRLVLYCVTALVSTARAGELADRWCFKPLAEVTPPPQSKAAWAKNAIDGFILARLEARAFRPQPEADRHTLIRRVSAGLTGLPPTLEEIEAFVSDKRPEAYANLVDRLLADPGYGERWARHWLDVARFGESDGILTVNEDKIRSNAWKYRDAVIRAYNEDLPFDRFVRYQLTPAPETERARYGELKQFIQLGTRLQKNADPNDRQFHRLDDMISTTGNAFLGLTFGCARCHDHPVDPMSSEEYYQFTAIFFDQVRENPGTKGKQIPLQITEPRVLKAGSWSSPGKKVEPGFLKVLMRQDSPHWLGDGVDKLDALSDWLTDTEQGAGEQLARVIVNRLWHHHFGRGLVSTPNDFGTLGARPSHPHLLDWLAARLIENGWRLKPVQKLIVTSAVYRQGAATDAAPLDRDADNIWLWQRRVQRLEAEIIRDRLLSVAGVLRSEMFGPSVFVGAYKKSVQDSPERWRRSIYQQAHRKVRHPTLGLFDPPDTERSTGARTTGTSPEGALFALNAPLVWALAEHFAKRVAEAGEDPAARIERAYLLALSRPPSQKEQDIGLAILKEEGEFALLDYCHLLLGLNEFIYIH